MSDSERWQRLRALFQAAFEQPPAARDAFLREACRDDEAMLDEVASLLAAHADAGGFLETPVFRVEEPPRTERAPALRPGDRLGRFEVTGALGAGGMGEVYCARDLRLGREVAIKVLPPSLATDPQRLARFERESRVLAALAHPNIATIHSVEDLNGLRLLVLELVEGPTLGERLRDGPVPLPDALAIARQLADALAAAHARGIVHRDLKPANVTLSPTGHVTLLDFGLAKARGGDEAAETGLLDAGLDTTAGLILGTWGYMSPEQARGRAVDHRTDIWAFGCVLFELLAGRPAFRGETPSDTLVAVLERAPDWSALPPGVPTAVQQLIVRCLEKDPARRPADIGEARRDLDATEEEAPDAARVRVPASGTGGTWRPDARSRVRLVLGVLVAAAAVAAWWLLRPAAIDELAVLPFENRSGEPDAEYLGEEIAGDLIGQLSRLPALTVMARATTARYGGDGDPRGAGQALGVDAVVTGSVLRRGERLVVAAELIEVGTGARLWGDTYDRPAADLLQVQDAIVSAIADRLRAGAAGTPALLGQGTGNVAAHDLVMRGRHLLQSDTEADDLAARVLFEQAVALDPAYIEPRLGLASTYLRSAGNLYAPPAEAQRKAGELLDSVLSLEPGNVRARASRASLLYQRDWNWAEAGREFEALVADARLYLGPQYHAPAMYFWAIGRPADAAAVLARALVTDPGNRETRLMRCDFEEEAGRLDEALACYREMVAEATDDARPHFGLAEVLRRRDELPGAIDALRSAYRAAGEDGGVARLAGARTTADYEAAELAVARLRLSALEDAAHDRYVSPLDIARLHAQLGDREPAFAALERALAERSPMLVLLKVDRAWDRVRTDPRFAAAVRRVGIP
jgi:TolB-like protein/cytochrome c-type biogenesis protein CcmH/NrfG